MIYEAHLASQYSSDVLCVSDIDSNLSVCKEKTTADISSSPIWDSSVRKEVLSTKMSDHQINKQKEENLVSGITCCIRHFHAP